MSPVFVVTGCDATLLGERLSQERRSKSNPTFLAVGVAAVAQVVATARVRLQRLSPSSTKLIEPIGV